MSLSPRHIIIRILQVVTIVLIGAYFINMYASVTEVRVSLSLENIWSLLLSIGLISMGFFLLPMPTLILLRALGKDIRFSSSMRIFFFSEVGKYLPGKVWVAVGRVLLYSKIGVKRKTAIFILALELVLMVLTALMFPGRMVIRHLTASYTFAAVLVCGVAILLYLISRRQRITAQGIGDYIKTFSIPVILIVLSFTLFWMVLGFAFQHLILYFSHINIGTFAAVRIFSGSWAAGFLAFFMPVGLGVREAFMTELLVPLIGNEHALMIAIVSRIWWTLVEATFILLSSGRMFSEFLRTNALPEIVR
ncbi:MAG: flippase-like domain-containing protein [Deltaproteobacteria bacterium]|nr:flippase-like domain-containing protein [Deltaproteobacteria bacterium]MBW2077817.1 flippase-like domain-containing protein [Deltaproteobacteria bacterium]MBW2310077.1 flippase-like domain-containing protein [Deltaproteobacteria bacterium]